MWQSLSGSRTETPGSQPPSGWKVASAPAHVALTPAFGLGPIPVLCTGQEHAGRWCSRVVAGPQGPLPDVCWGGVKGYKTGRHQLPQALQGPTLAPQPLQITRAREHRDFWGPPGSCSDPQATVRGSPAAEAADRGRRRWEVTTSPILYRPESATLTRPKEPPTTA